MLIFTVWKCHFIGVITSSISYKCLDYAPEFAVLSHQIGRMHFVCFDIASETVGWCCKIRWAGRPGGVSGMRNWEIVCLETLPWELPRPYVLYEQLLHTSLCMMMFSVSTAQCASRFSNSKYLQVFLAHLSWPLACSCSATLPPLEWHQKHGKQNMSCIYWWLTAVNSGMYSRDPSRNAAVCYCNLSIVTAEVYWMTQ
jgi:hypothetical protein